MQFGFMQRHGTTNIILILKQLQEIFLTTKKNFNFAFVNLEKAVY